MVDPKDIGFWIGVLGGVGAIVWNALNFMRHPTFVSRSRVDDLTTALTESRSLIVDLRAEIVDLKGKLATLEMQVRALMTECQWWRDQYRELKERQSPKKDG